MNVYGVAVSFLVNLRETIFMWFSYLRSDFV